MLGLGPRLKILIQLQSLSVEDTLKDISVVFLYDADIYTIERPYINVSLSLKVFRDDLFHLLTSSFKFFDELIMLSILDSIHNAKLHLQSRNIHQLQFKCKQYNKPGNRQ